MTDDTETPPERIWAWPTYSWLSGAWAQTRFPETAESYTRADLALAAQGALIERAARVAWYHDWVPDPILSPGNYRVYATAMNIRALSPDATAAIEAVRREERERCAEKAREHVHWYRNQYDNTADLASSIYAAIRDIPPQET